MEMVMEMAMELVVEMVMITSKAYNVMSLPQSSSSVMT